MKNRFITLPRLIFERKGYPDDLVGEVMGKGREGGGLRHRRHTGLIEQIYPGGVVDLASITRPDRITWK